MQLGQLKTYNCFLSQNENIKRNLSLGFFLKYSFKFANLNVDLFIKCILLGKERMYVGQNARDIYYKKSHTNFTF